MILDKPLTEIGGKGLFTKELDVQLLVRIHDFSRFLCLQESVDLKREETRYIENAPPLKKSELQTFQCCSGSFRYWKRERWRGVECAEAAAAVYNIPVLVFRA